MNPDLYSPTYGRIVLVPGWPQQATMPVLPHAHPFWCHGAFGSIHLQEIHTDQYLLRYFSFYFLERMELRAWEKAEGLQSLILLKGGIEHGIKRKEVHHIGEGQYALLRPVEAETQTIIPAGRECRILNTYYPNNSFKDLLSCFPNLQKDLKPAHKKASYFLTFPRPVRRSVLDAVHEVLFESYRPELLKVFWGLKLKETLFTQLAQTYTENPRRPSTPVERERALKIKEKIEQDLSTHITIEELAKELNASVSSVKRAFTNEYGMGIYEYLKSVRMHKARELLLQGAQIKTAAIEVGMGAAHFTTEFRKFFGYKASSLKQ